MNPIHKPIDTLFKKLNFLYFQISYFQQRIQRLKKSIRTKVEKHEKFKLEDLFHGSSLPITDLTGPTDNGLPYAYRTGRHFVSGEKYIEQLDWFIKKEAASTVRQGYEVFETFLYDVTATYYYQNQKKITTDIFENNLPDKSDYNLEEWRSAVRGIFRRKPNYDLISLLRSLGDELSKAESVKFNNRNLNLIDWYEITTQLRHGSTHSLGKINQEGLNKLSKSQKELLKESYPGEFSENGYILKLTPMSAKLAMSRYAEYGFAIFKSLSIEQNYNWEYLLKN